MSASCRQSNEMIFFGDAVGKHTNVNDKIGSTDKTRIIIYNVQQRYYQFVNKNDDYSSIKANPLRHCVVEILPNKFLSFDSYHVAIYEHKTKKIFNVEHELLMSDEISVGISEYSQIFPVSFANCLCIPNDSFVYVQAYI